MDALRAKLLQNSRDEDRGFGSACRVWLGCVNGSLYGSLTFQGITYLAHRAAWLCWHQGPIPQNLVVMHLCGVRRCLNPEHLQLGSHKQNQAMRADRMLRVAA
jgi:hypothetical protein